MTQHTVRLSTLLERSGCRPVRASGADPEITEVALDSRKVVPGGLFCALRGLKHDGASFVADALRRGARAIVAESPRPDDLHEDVAWVRVERAREAAALLAREWHGRPDASLCLVGVTGTNGKTSVVYLLESFAREAGRMPGRVGTVSYAFGGREWAAVHTTPEAPDLYRLLAAMREHEVDIVAMEVSSHALALHRVHGARFAVGAFLNLSRDHLDFHADMASYRAAKARLVETLDDTATAVLSADDPEIASLAESTRARVVSFGRSEGSTVRILDEACRLDGTDVVLEAPGGTLELHSPLAGRFMPDNLAGAAACALGAGIPLDAVASGAARLGGIPGRMERIDRGQPFAVMVDYAHTPHALDRLLRGVRSMIEGRTLVVFGCGGDRDRGKRAPMGRVAAEAADRIYLTSDNPRGEDPEAILREIERGVAQVPGATERVRVVADRAEAVGLAVREASPGDAVVIAGKGHEATQTFADRSEPFDDRAVAAEALVAAGFRGGCRAGA